MTARFLALMAISACLLTGQVRAQNDGGAVAAGGEGTIPNPTAAGGNVAAGGEGTIPNPSSAGGAIPQTQNLNVAMKNLNTPVSDLNVAMKNLNVPPSGSTTEPTNPTSVPTGTTTGATNPTDTASNPTTGTDTNPTSATGSGGTDDVTSTGQNMQVYSTAYNPSEAGGSINAQGSDLAPGQVAVNPNVIPYGTQFTVDNDPALNQAAIAEGAPVDANGNAVFTATDTGSAVVAGTAATANGYAGTPVVDFYSPTSSYSSMAGATSSPVTITIVKPASS